MTARARPRARIGCANGGGLARMHSVGRRPLIALLITVIALSCSPSSAFAAAVPEPSFTIELEQKLEGESGYFKRNLAGKLGHTVDYRIVVKNTGNTELHLGELEDPRCENITPLEEIIVPVHGTETYFCEHNGLTYGAYQDVAFISNNFEKLKESNKCIVEDPYLMHEANVEVLVEGEEWTPEEGWPPKENVDLGTARLFQWSEISEKGELTLHGQESRGMSVERLALLTGVSLKRLTGVAVTEDEHQEVMTLDKEEALNEAEAPYLDPEEAQGQSRVSLQAPRHGQVVGLTDGSLVVVLTIEGGWLELAPLRYSPAQPSGDKAVEFARPHVEGGEEANTPATFFWTFGDGTTAETHGTTKHIYKPTSADPAVVDYEASVEEVIRSFDGQVVSAGTKFVTVEVQNPNAGEAKEPQPQPQPQPQPNEPTNEGPPKEPAQEPPRQTPAATPDFTIQTEQRLGGEGTYWLSKLTAEVGQDVEYRIFVKNTGNTELRLGELTDAGCEDIAPSGPVTIPAGSGETYTCEHKSLALGTYTDVASAANGSEAPVQSNVVEVEVRAPHSVPPPPPERTGIGAPGGSTGPSGPTDGGGTGKGTGGNGPGSNDNGKRPPGPGSGALSENGGTGKAGEGTGTSTGNGSQTGTGSGVGSNQAESRVRAHAGQAIAPTAKQHTGLVGVLLNSVAGVLPVAALAGGSAVASVPLRSLARGSAASVGTFGALGLVLGIVATLLAVILGALGELRMKRRADR